MDIETFSLCPKQEIIVYNFDHCLLNVAAFVYDGQIWEFSSKILNKILWNGQP